MTNETIIGVAASACTAASLIPQLVKVLREKKAADVSLGMLLVLFAGLTLWIYYGIIKEDLIIIISNGFSLLINVALSIVSVKYKRREQPSAG